ncbi:DUF3224 domain-containing protein [Myxococcaceae bacterium JPH2]|nr:DUF3224 domain-containing protein [Myxococcaceae bacterium JPH2]
MKHRATGPFDVKVTPMPPEAQASDSPVGRLWLDKRFHGDLDATSLGQMLAVRSAVEGSAGYVAMECVTGTLQGRTGTFCLQHTGTAVRGEKSLTITVVPDSGTGELRGLSGSVKILIESGGKHFYDFEYSLAETP